MSTPKAISILGLYKKLHRTSQRVFKGDENALRIASLKIRSEYEKNKGANKASVRELYQLGSLFNFTLTTNLFS